MTHTMSSTDERGFGLVEAMIATLVTAVGVLSVAALMGLGARMQYNAKTGSAAVGLATWELERIRTLVPTAPERLDGGSLTANVANHWIMRGTTRLRWTIANRENPAAPGVPALCAPQGGVPGAALECAKDIVVVAITPNEQDVPPRITSILFR
jgi:hypothetical protein